MRVRPRLWILSASALATIGILTAYATRHREPRYNGHTLQNLLREATYRHVMRPATPGYNNAGWYADPAPQDAVRQIGTNALPQLIRMISYEPDPLRLKLLQFAKEARQTRIRRLIPASFATDQRAADADLAVKGFRLLGAIASPAVPELERLAGSPQCSDVANRAIDALGEIGQPALPALRRLSKNQRTRLRAFVGILQVGHRGIPITTEIQEIIDQGDMVAEMAIHALRRFPATNALPILTNLLTHPQSRIRKAAAENLPWFFPDARCAIPALYETVNDTNADVSTAGLDALRHLAPEMFVTNTPSQ
jgi:hypothetical protein